jgi:SAM-dependent methyltransferase
MDEPTAPQASRYYDSIAAGYDAQVTSPGDRWARDAFRSLVLGAVSPPALLLDFGCRTGLDAVWYAEQGYRVRAFDVSQGMVEQLRQRARTFLDDGTIEASCLPLEVFLDTLPAHPRPDVIVSNFAVLNLVEDPRPVIDALTAHLLPGGHFVMSVLNPWFWKDSRHAWWWRAVTGSVGRPTITVRGPPVTTYRHRVSRLRRLAGRRCTLIGQASVGGLVRRHAGKLDWAAPRSVSALLEKRFHQAAPLRHLGQFVFLDFRRTS